MEELRKVEKKKLFERLTPAFLDAIERFIEENGWTLTEVSQHIGVAPNRLSEVRTEGRYRKPVSEGLLKKSAAGGVLKVWQVVEDAELSEHERNYIQKLTVFDEPLAVTEGELLIERRLRNPKERTAGEILRDYRLGVLVEAKRNEDNRRKKGMDNSG